MKKQVTIFLDLDDVVTNWLDSIAIAVHKSPAIYDPYRDRPEELTYDKRTELLGREAMNNVMANSLSFWRDMPKHRWADELVDACCKQFPVAFLTSPSRYAVAAQGKMLWRDRNYPTVPIILTSDKHMVASEDKFLVDDDLFQMSRFLTKGHGWLFDSQFILNQYTPTEITEYIKHIVDSALTLQQHLNR